MPSARSFARFQLLELESGISVPAALAIKEFPEGSERQ